MPIDGKLQGKHKSEWSSSDLERERRKLIKFVKHRNCIIDATLLARIESEIERRYLLMASRKENPMSTETEFGKMAEEVYEQVIADIECGLIQVPESLIAAMKRVGIEVVE